MRAATLFSGIGSPELSMPGWDWLWHAEIDTFASAVMARRNGTPNLGDVSAPDFAERALEHGRPDVVVFGSPCQSFSIAGKRRGLDDPRGDLALVALRVLRRLRPRWLCFENVPGLLSNADGADFGAFLRAVAECGYLGCWRVLDAQFAGVPQRRRRVFFVGYLGDWRRAAAVLFEPASLRGHPAPSRETWERTARPVAACAPGGSGYRNDADTADSLIAADLRNGALGDLAQTMQSGGANGERGLSINSLPHVVGAMASCGGTDRKHGHGMGQQDWERGYAIPVPVAHTLNAKGGAGRIDGESETFVAVAIRTDQQGANGHGIAQDVCHTLDSHVQAIAFAENSRAELRLEGGDGQTCAALKTGGGKPGQSYPAAIVGTAVRRLTPRECERLQGLPDDHTLITYRGKPAADGPRYRAIGNAMAVPIIRWILQRIEMADQP